MNSVAYCSLTGIYVEIHFSNNFLAFLKPCPLINFDFVKTQHLKICMSSKCPVFSMSEKGKSMQQNLSFLCFTINVRCELFFCIQRVSTQLYVTMQFLITYTIIMSQKPFISQYKPTEVNNPVLSTNIFMNLNECKVCCLLTFRLTFLLW